MSGTVKMLDVLLNVFMSDFSNDGGSAELVFGINGEEEVAIFGDSGFFGGVR